MLSQNLKTKKGKVFLTIILIIFIFYVGFLFGKITNGKIAFKFNSDIYQQTELPDVFNSILTNQVWSILQNDFVDQDKIDEKELFYGALKGMVDGVGDPYTVFMDQEMTADFYEQMSGEFEGIGAQIGIKDGQVIVIAPLPETPADKAGLKAGDKIYSVDNVEVRGLTLDQVVKMIRGKKGSKVTLLIVSGEEAPKEVVIVRDVIEIKSVKWEFRDNGIAYVEINSFNNDTVDLFNKFIKDFKNKGAQKIVLDLRNDPGGLLDSALQITSNWVDSNLIMIEKFGDGREVKYNGQGKAVLKDIPTVVLINKGSASGSEIVAGALQDYELAQIVGEQSYGKGSVQALKALTDGSNLKVTIAKWMTPNGRSINDEGIKPDIEIELTEQDFLDEKDPQLDKAIELLSEK